MRKTSKKALAFLLAAVMLLGAVGCGGKEDNKGDVPPSANNGGESTGEKVVTMAVSNEWESLNPYGSSGNYTDVISDQVYDRLLISNLDGSTEPRLAEKYEVADDHSSITFYLNKNAKFHDGEPVTADDVLFSAHLDANPNFNSLKRTQCRYFAGTDETGVETSEGSLAVEKIDDYTVKFTFKEPMNELPVLSMFNRYFYVIPEHIFGEFTMDELNGGEVWKENMIGSGPLKYDSSIDGERVEFTANKDYYLGAPDFDRLILRVVETSQMLSGLMAGEIDIVAGAGIASIPLSDWPAAKEMEDTTTFSGAGYSYQAIIFNTAGEKTKDAKVRQALNMAINRQTIVDSLLEGEASILYGPYPDYHPVYAADLAWPSYDPEKAKTMLQEAGFDFNQTLELIVPTGNEIRIQSTVLIQQDLEAIGVKTNITQYDFATLMQKMRDGDFDLGMCGSAGSVDGSEPGGWLNKNSTTNFSCLQDDTFGDAYTKAINEVDADKQKEAYKEIQQLVIDESPIGYLYSQNQLMAYKNRLTNMKPDRFGQLNWCVWEWKVD